MSEDARVGASLDLLFSYSVYCSTALLSSPALFPSSAVAFPVRKTPRLPRVLGLRRSGLCDDRAILARIWLSGRPAEPSGAVEGIRGSVPEPREARRQVSQGWSGGAQRSRATPGHSPPQKIKSRPCGAPERPQGGVFIASDGCSLAKPGFANRSFTPRRAGAQATGRATEKNASRRCLKGRHNSEGL